MAMILVLFALCCGGCSSAPYWHHDPTLKTTASPLIVLLEPGRLARACGNASAAECYKPATGIIYVRSDLTPAGQKCAESHGRMHAQGWTHAYHAAEFAIDCGDQTLWVPPLPSRLQASSSSPFGNL